MKPKKRRLIAMSLIALHAPDVADPVDFDRCIDFELKRSRRKTLSLEVRAGKLIVRSPLFLSDRDILQFIKQKKAWINKKIRETNNSDKVISSDEIFFLGEILKVVPSDVFKWELDAENKCLLIAGKKIKNSAVLKNFYKTQTKVLIEEIIDEFKNDFCFETGKIRYRFYKSRWGSCSSANVLSFNAYLSATPREVIRYVVVHELCHINHKNHKKDFWRSVEKYDSYFKNHRRILKKQCIENL
ncbi:MAG: WLM domain protein [candidate division WS2 bacterium ADurb.Bin280]|uniref:WLM domain protein n=1 Tax=candidate division WS2 bacterium ADurb.Bin280 TaxID=1852829 RepID=A0A1V5SFZ4_9BACT|nr:MAG: WLM domain protein [candidate division WS2 bacterium ADurb.Bin280]